MTKLVQKNTVKLHFFFDYNCGGCLWGANRETFEKFGHGCLDAEITDLKGNIIQKPLINLPKELKDKVLRLDELFAQSLNWENPAGESNWTKQQWEYFYKMANDVYLQISEFMGSDFEIVNKYYKSDS